MHASKPSDTEIVIAWKFAAPRQRVWAALTQAKHLRRWMQSPNLALVACEVDLRSGGSFRYLFERPSGRKLEVRGAYETIDPPHRFVYTETYDFSPLQISVTTALQEAGGLTTFKQTLAYASKQERDDDFDGVAASATEVYANLERYLRDFH